MSKYSNEFKLKVVKYYIEENHGFIDTARYFNIPSKTLVQRWVRKYKEHGEKGLSRNIEKYDGEFKQKVIEYMHENHLSLQETSIKFNLGNHDIVDRWERLYYEKGPQALYQERRGRDKKMSSKSEKKKANKEVNEDLVEEVRRLRMENAYLKKLQALVQERTKPKQSKK